MADGDLVRLDKYDGLGEAPFGEGAKWRRMEVAVPEGAGSVSVLVSSHLKVLPRDLELELEWRK